MSSPLHIFDPDGDLTFVFSVIESWEGVESGEEGQKVTELSASEQEKTGEVDEGLEANDTHADDTITRVEVRFQVSSKHLTLASPVFKAMLKPSFAEGEALCANGKVEIPLPDDPHEPFAIIMDIIHGQGRRVPREVSLNLLAQLAALVDKYGLYTAVDVFSDPWIAGLESTVATCSHVDLFHWISISWVFRSAALFKEATKIVFMRLSVSDCERALATIEKEHDLPVPSRVLDYIKEQRKICFQQIYQIINEEIEYYTTSSNKHRCKTSRFYGEQQELCDTLVLGSLLRSLASKTTMWPMSEAVCRELSWKVLLKEIGNVRVTTICNGTTLGKDGQGVVLGMLKQVNAISSLTGGLDLAMWM